MSNYINGEHIAVFFGKDGCAKSDELSEKLREGGFIFNPKILPILGT